MKSDFLAELQQFLGQEGLRGGGRSIRQTRTSRDMLGSEFATRLGVSPARVSVLERDEQRGAVTLRMMQRAAQALDCDFVYALVPRQTGGRAETAGTRKRKLRVDSNYQAMSREQQVQSLESQMAVSADSPDADV